MLLTSAKDFAVDVVLGNFWLVDSIDCWELEQFLDPVLHK